MLIKKKTIWAELVEALSFYDYTIQVYPKDEQIIQRQIGQILIMYEFLSINSKNVFSYKDQRLDYKEAKKLALEYGVKNSFCDKEGNFKRS